MYALLQRAVFNGIIIIAVSYTHLDVYKRQDMDRALEILKNHNSFTTERERQQRDILIAAIDLSLIHI